MAIEKCRAEIREAAGTELSDDDIDRIIASVRAHGETLRRQGVPGDTFGRAAKELSEMDRAVAARKQLTAYQDLQKRQALAAKVADLNSKGIPLAKAVDALTRGISHDVEGARDSTAQEQLSRQNDFTGRLLSSLDKIPGALKAWRSATETTNWVRELAELNSKDGKPGITKSPMALKIAQAVHDAQDLARYHLNQSGAWIGDYDGYVSRTRHDPLKVDKAGFEGWRDFTLAHLDQDKTFMDLLGDADLAGAKAGNGDALIDRFMHNVWDALSTGVHISSDHGVGAKAPAFTGPGNMGKRVSSERVLHWKDADSWLAYQKRFGDPSIERGVMDGLIRAGRDTALMNRWGSNPRYTFDNLLRSIEEEHRSDHTTVAAFQAQKGRLQEEFAHLSGEAARPGNSLAWKIRGSILAAQDITKLPFVLFTHLSVGATKPFQLMYHGMGAWQAYTSVLRNLMQDKSPEGRAVLENLRANATGQTQNIMSGYEPVAGVPGKIAQLRMTSMRLGGLPWTLGREKSGSEWELANFYGQNVAKQFESLNPKTQRALKIYGMGPKEWDALRTAPDHDKDVHGSTYLTPAAAGRASNEAIDAIAGDRLKDGQASEVQDEIRAETRDRLAMKLAGLYSDSAERSTVTPGIPERAFMTLHGGRFGGPILGQYKSWAMAATRQMWGQAIYGSSKAEAVKALAGLVATGTALGYARLVITDALQGKEPRTFTGDPRQDAQLVMASMLGGSGLGLVGDMFLGQLSEEKSGSGHERVLKYIANLAGPAIGDAADVGGIGLDYLDAWQASNPGKAIQNANAEATRKLIGSIPIVNAFYFRTIMNWLIFDRLQEMASPGYLQRYQARVKKETGQNFWLPPTQYAGAH